jgi:hypothetical protein
MRPDHTAEEEAPAFSGPAIGKNTPTIALISPPRTTASGESHGLPASPAESLHGPGGVPLGVARGAGRLASDVPAETGPSLGRLSLPPACGAELLASFSPFDLAKVETAIDQLLESLDDLETGLSRLGRTEGLVPGLAAIGLAIGATQLFHRRLIQRPDGEGRQGAVDEDRDADVCHPGLPGLPRHWNLEES